MLVLGRKTGEEILITCPNGDEIRLTVVDIDRAKMRLGIDAPRSYTIMRTEIVEGFHDNPPPRG